MDHKRLDLASIDYQEKIGREKTHFRSLPVIFQLSKNVDLSQHVDL